MRFLTTAICLLLTAATGLPAMAAPQPQDWVLHGKRVSPTRAVKRCRYRVNATWGHILKGAYEAQAEARTSKDPTIHGKLHTIETAIVQAQFYQYQELKTCQIAKN